MTINQYLKGWSQYNTQVQLLACPIILISFLISICTFISLLISSRQNYIEYLNTVYQVYELVLLEKSWNLQNREIVQLLEDFYLSSPSIKYLIISNQEGLMSYIFPEKTICENIHLNSQTVISFSLLIVYNYRYSVLFDIFTNKPDVSIKLSNLQLQNVYSSLIINDQLDFNCILFYGILSIIFATIWITSTVTILFYLLINKSSINIISRSTTNFKTDNLAIAGGLSMESIGILLSFNSILYRLFDRLKCHDKINIQKLVAEKAKLETLVSMMADGAILLDKDLRIIFMNKSAWQIFTLCQSYTKCNYISDYFPVHVNKQLLPIINDLVKTNYNKTVSQFYEFSMQLTSDTSKTFQLIITQVFSCENYTIGGVGIIIKDITSQVDLHETKAQFISNVSHELRTPLFNIRAFLDTLSEYRYSLTEQQQIEFLDIANQETQRLTHLVNDILDLSRLESDFVDSMDIIELYDIISSIHQTSQVRAWQNYLHLVFKISGRIFPISGYSHLLLQVLSNLIGNSLKFTPVHGRIFIKVYTITQSSYVKPRYSKKIRVEVIDEGTGMKEDDQKCIYDRFVSLKNNTHNLKGTGLGLSIVKDIIIKHQSKIVLYSEFGLGSSFWFDLYLLQKKK